MAYTTVAELRLEGVPGGASTVYTDAVVLDAIALATEYINRVTGQFFESTPDVRVFDGSGTKRLVLDVPILTLTKVEWLQFGATWQDVTTMNTFRLYNKIPQDQGYPKVEIFSSRDSLQADIFGVWPIGPQNIRLTGTWGWVENTGTQAVPVYAVPKLINRACKILAVAWMDTIGDGSLLAMLKSYGVIEERTKHHSYKLADAMSAGEMTGIPIVDQILRRFKRTAAAAHV